MSASPRRRMAARIIASLVLGFMVAFLLSGIAFHLVNGSNAALTTTRTGIEWFCGTWAVMTVSGYALLRWANL